MDGPRSGEDPKGVGSLLFMQGYLEVAISPISRSTINFRVTVDEEINDFNQPKILLYSSISYHVDESWTSTCKAMDVQTNSPFCPGFGLSIILSLNFKSISVRCWFYGEPEIPVSK